MHSGPADPCAQLSANTASPVKRSKMVAEWVG
jgi:hypothetical protein